MRRFSIRRLPTTARGLIVEDLDTNNHICIDGPSFEICKIQARFAIMQRLALEEAPRPQCPYGCYGGLLKEQGNNTTHPCPNQPCFDWYTNAMTILDRVETSVHVQDAEIGGFEL
jgi:hypothetical protein